MTNADYAAGYDDGLDYRYALSRHWGDGESQVFVMLNPSTADATLDDPTIRRCMGFARRDGYDGLVVVNLYAYRSTDPKALFTGVDAVGPQNDDYLRLLLAERVRRGLPVIAAWGANARLDRVGAVLNLVSDVDWRCLGTTKQGAPKHPLYIKGDQPLVPFPWAEWTTRRDRSDA